MGAEPGEARDTTGDRDGLTTGKGRHVMAELLVMTRLAQVP
jgi:hypothetical protein